MTDEEETSEILFTVIDVHCSRYDVNQEEKLPKPKMSLEAASAALTALSLKRIADALQSPNEYGEVGSAALAGAISRSLRDR